MVVGRGGLYPASSCAFLSIPCWLEFISTSRPALLASLSYRAHHWREPKETLRKCLGGKVSVTITKAARFAKLQLSLWSLHPPAYQPDTTMSSSVNVPAPGAPHQELSLNPEQRKFLLALGLVYNQARQDGNGGKFVSAVKVRFFADNPVMANPTMASMVLDYKRVCTLSSVSESSTLISGNTSAHTS